MPPGLNKSSATYVNVPITDMPADKYDIVSITPYTTDVSILATPFSVPQQYVNASRISLSLINQYNSALSCTVYVIVGFKAK